MDKSSEKKIFISRDQGSDASPLEPVDPIHILHLSDLHFGDLGNAKNWYDQLAEDLINELDIQRLDGLILSGDIANYSEPEEYGAAEHFLGEVCREFALESAQVVIVPGNHDVNWKLARKGYRLEDREDCEEGLKEGLFIEVGDDVVRLREESKYRKRFDHFGKFYQSVKREPYPTEYADQVTLHHLPAQNLLILGLNSAWNIDHHFTSRAEICPDAVSNALRMIRRKYDEALKIAVFHHPLISPFEDRLKDHGFMDRLAGAGFRLALHGHIHKAETNLYAYDVTADGRKLHVVGAGTFGVPVEEWTPGHPLQYNLLRFEKERLTVETRCRRELNGTWRADAIWNTGKGKDPLPRYFIDFPGWSPRAPGSGNRERKGKGADGRSEADASDGSASGKDAASEAEIDAYCKKAESLHEYLPVAGFRTRLRVPIRIEDIYVALRAVIDLRATGESCFADAEDAEAKCLGRGDGMEISVVDAFHESERLKRRGIVILGDPGSGKTTHLRRLMLWFLRGGKEQLGLPSEMIPVFLPLRDLRDLGKGLDAFIQEQLDLPHLETPPGFGERLLRRGNLLLLFDGLDEVADPKQRGLVSKWIDEALLIHDRCRFMVTCRFAGYTDAARLSPAFLEMHMRPLMTDQAETFICNWYRSVEVGLSSDPDQAKIIAEDRAKDLIERLRQPEFRSRRVFEMTRNPLLLTNLCLVHRDRGNLPRKRARLYEECIDVMLELWRTAIGFKSRVTAESGRRVLQPAALWLHGEEGRTRAKAEEIAPVIESTLQAVGWPHGDAVEFLRAVRDDSGLLTGWSGEEYGFMHLGFQEYLAAREIWRRHLSSDPSALKDLAGQFGKSWWQEVILLLLSLQEVSLFEPLMQEVVKSRAFVAHSDLVEMCLDDAAEVSLLPFTELLKVDPGKQRDLWERQYTALQVIRRWDEGIFDRIGEGLRKHPYEKIRKLIAERMDQARQKVIRPEPSGYELVLIPGGSFMMGSPESEKGRDDDEGPVHEVHVPAFYMGRYPVTNEEYGRYLKANPNIQEPSLWSDRKYNQPSQPVVGVSWRDANRYAEWAGLELPTEAQWEYACRAGTTTRFYTGNDDSDLDRAGWFSNNSGGQTHPVGEKEPNDFGLYDMHGNVWEWVQDDFHGSYKGAPVDGSAWVDDPRCEVRVIRGGSWGFYAVFCRSANRRGLTPVYRDGNLGFRLLRSLP